MILLRGIRWAAGFAALIALLPLVALFSALGRRRAASLKWCALALRIFSIRVLVRGQMPPPGSLVAMNHLSYFDPVIVGAVIPGRFLAKKEIERWPVAGLVGKVGKVIFIDRDSPRSSMRTMNEIASLLAGKESILVFAEGGIRGDGVTVAPFMPMLFEAAVRAKSPVVPLAIRYLRPGDPRVWKWSEGSLAGHLFKKVLAAGPMLVELSIGEPVILKEGMRRKEAALVAHERVSGLFSGGNP